MLVQDGREVDYGTDYGTTGLAGLPNGTTGLDGTGRIGAKSAPRDNSANPVGRSRPVPKLLESVELICFVKFTSSPPLPFLSETFLVCLFFCWKTKNSVSSAVIF